MSFALVFQSVAHTQPTALEESIMTATYTFDVFFQPRRLRLPQRRRLGWLLG